MNWFSRCGIYWLNGWQLALIYALGKTWFVPSVAGFPLPLRAAVQPRRRAEYGWPARIGRKLAQDQHTGLTSRTG